MHVGHADTSRGPAECLEEAIGGERRSSFAHKYVAQASRLIAAQLAECPNFDPAQRLDAVVTPFAPDYLQSSCFEVYVIPTQSHELTNAHSMSVRHQDHGGVSMPVAPPFSRRIA
jgi:hypothetical protein